MVCGVWHITVASCYCVQDGRYERTNHCEIATVGTWFYDVYQQVYCTLQFIIVCFVRYAETVALKTINPYLKMVLSVGGWNFGTATGRRRCRRTPTSKSSFRGQSPSWGAAISTALIWTSNTLEATEVLRPTSNVSSVFKGEVAVVSDLGVICHLCTASMSSQATYRLSVTCHRSVTDMNGAAGDLRVIDQFMATGRRGVIV